MWGFYVNLITLTTVPWFVTSSSSQIRRQFLWFPLLSLKMNSFVCECIANTIYPIISEMYFVGKVSSLSKISTYMYKMSITTNFCCYKWKYQPEHPQKEHDHKPIEPRLDGSTRPNKVHRWVCLYYNRKHHNKSPRQDYYCPPLWTEAWSISWSNWVKMSLSSP